MVFFEEVNPKNFMANFLVISLLHITSGTSSFLENLWKRKILNFVLYSNNLFVVNLSLLRKIPYFYLISWCENLWKSIVGQIVRNHAETVPFHKIFTSRNLVKLLYFSRSLVSSLLVLVILNNFFIFLPVKLLHIRSWITKQH